MFQEGANICVLWLALRTCVEVNQNIDMLSGRGALQMQLLRLEEAAAE